MIGAGSIIGAFKATIGLDTKDYAKGIINAQTLNKVFGESFTAFVANPLLGSVAILKRVGGAFVAAATQQLAYAETLQRTGQQLGVAEQLLIALEKRLQVAGAAGDIGHKSLQKFAVGLMDLQRGAGPLKDLGDALGLVLDPTASLEHNFGVVLDAINRLPTAAQRSAAAAKVFGEEAGPKLINAIGGGSDAMREMIREAEQLGFRTRTAANDGLAGLNTQLGYLQMAVSGIKYNAIQSFFDGVTQGSTGSVQGILQTSNAINNELTPALRSIGREAGPLLRDVAAVLPGIVNFTGDLLKNIRALGDLFDNSWFEKAWNLQRDSHALLIRQIGFRNQLTPGQQRLMEMSPVQQANRVPMSAPSMVFMNGF